MNVYEEQASFVGNAGYLDVLALQHILSQRRQCSPMRSVFSRLLTRRSQLAGSIRDSITRVFPPVSQVPSALCPGMTGFHQLYSYGSVRRCSPVLGAQLVPSVPKSGSEHDWRPSHDRLSLGVHRDAHLLAAFSRHLSRCYPFMDRPAVLCWLCAMRPVVHNDSVARQLLHSYASCCPRCFRI